MRKTLLLIAVLFGALVMSGCEDSLVNVTVQNPFDLRIQVWDDAVDGAFAGALVTVYETDDASHSGLDGWTDLLKTPANAQHVTVIVQWEDRAGFKHSYQTNVGLQHQVVTTARMHVDSRPPR